MGVFGDGGSDAKEAAPVRVNKGYRGRSWGMYASNEALPQAARLTRPRASVRDLALGDKLSAGLGVVT